MNDFLVFDTYVASYLFKNSPRATRIESEF